MANFPASNPSFATLVDLVDNVLASHQNSPNREIEAIGAYVLASLMRQSELHNGYFERTVTSNNLTVAIKAMDGTDPSATNPVTVKIGATKRSITSALSVTVNAAANTFNAGASELATKEIDYFVYLGWRASNSSVFLIVARFPHAKTYADFSSTATNEKYGAYSGSSPASTDEVENIGRFNATLSAGAGYTWSIPATSIIVNKPIFETRVLDWVPSFSGFSSMTVTGTSLTHAKYQIDKNELIYDSKISAFTIGGTPSAIIYETLPFRGLLSASSPFAGGMLVADSGGSAFGGCRLDNATPERIAYIKYNAGSYAAGAGTVLISRGTYFI